MSWRDILGLKDKAIKSGTSTLKDVNDREDALRIAKIVGLADHLDVGGDLYPQGLKMFNDKDRKFLEEMVAETSKISAQRKKLSDNLLDAFDDLKGNNFVNLPGIGTLSGTSGDVSVSASFNIDPDGTIKSIDVVPPASSLVWLRFVLPLNVGREWNSDTMDLIWKIYKKHGETIEDTENLYKIEDGLKAFFKLHVNNIRMGLVEDKEQRTNEFEFMVTLDNEERLSKLASFPRSRLPFSDTSQIKLTARVLDFILYAETVEISPLGVVLAIKCQRGCEGVVQNELTALFKEKSSSFHVVGGMDMVNDSIVEAFEVTEFNYWDSLSGRVQRLL